MVGRARLTLDDLATRPEPGMDAPGAAKFAPDGRSITYLFSANGSLVRSLWSQDLVSGTRSVIASPSPETTREETLSREDHLLRERTRTTELGVTSYSWASAALEPTLLVPISGRLFVAVGDEPAQALHPIAGVEHASGALLSPDGSLVSYSADGELYVAPIRGGSPRRLTGDAEAGVSSGLADFIAAEELDRFEGAWWAADSRSIAFAHVDERGVPPSTIAHRGEGEGGETHHYPFAGGPNALVSLRVVAASGSASRSVALGMQPDDYLARVVTHPAGGWLAAVLPRDQGTLSWHRVGDDGSSLPLWVEESDAWINLDGQTQVLPDGRMLRSTERGGFRHLEIRSPNGDLERVLTSGE